MSATANAITIHIKMLSGDILSVSVPDPQTNPMIVRKIYRIIRDALPEEMRPWYLDQMSLISCREESPLSEDEVFREVFQAEEDDCFLLVMKPNRYDVWVKYMRQEMHENGTVYDVYNFGIDAPDGSNIADDFFYVNKDNHCVFSRDVIYTRSTGRIRFPGDALMYSPNGLFQYFMQDVIEVISEEEMPDDFDELYEQLRIEVERDRQERSSSVEPTH